MKKGVSLRVQIYVEGEDAPANDFAKTGQNFILQVLANGMKGYTGPYLLGVKQIVPLEGSDGDGDSDDSDDSNTEDDASSGFIASWSGTSGAGGTASSPATSPRVGGTGGSGPAGNPA